MTTRVFDLKAWCKAHGFAWSPYTRRDGKPDGDMVCNLGTIATSDDGSRLVAIVSADEPADDDPFDIISAIAHVSLKRSTLDSGVYAFEFCPARLGNIAVLMRACREQRGLIIPWPALAARRLWRVQHRRTAAALPARFACQDR